MKEVKKILFLFFIVNVLVVVQSLVRPRIEMSELYKNFNAQMTLSNLDSLELQENSPFETESESEQSEAESETKFEEESISAKFILEMSLTQFFSKFSYSYQQLKLNHYSSPLLFPPKSLFI